MSSGEHGNSLENQIGKALEGIIQSVEEDVKLRSKAKRYLGKINKSYKERNIEELSKLLDKASLRKSLLECYPVSKEVVEDLSVYVRREVDRSYAQLYDRIEDYCRENGITFQGNRTSGKVIVDHLLSIEIKRKEQAVKVGVVNARTIDSAKLIQIIQDERERIWGRPFDPSVFRDDVLQVGSRILSVKPNPVSWVLLDDVYHELKRLLEERNPNWKKSGRLISYYKDEFSADLSKLWKAQAQDRLDEPYIEFSAIRNAKLSYHVILPDGKTTSYGHVRRYKGEKQ